MMAEERSTFAYPTFPTITQTLINHPDFDSTDLGTVRSSTTRAGGHAPGRAGEVPAGRRS